LATLPQPAKNAKGGETLPLLQACIQRKSQACVPRSARPKAGGVDTDELKEIDGMIDSSLDALEAHATKFSGVEELSFVKKERVEIEFLPLLEPLLAHLEKVVKAEDRGILVRCLGDPFVRLARVNYLLENVPLSEQRAEDARWTDLKESCAIIESVLRDLNPAKYKNWRDLKRATLFVPAFGLIEEDEDEDASSEDDSLGDRDPEIDMSRSQMLGDLLRPRPSGAPGAAESPRDVYDEPTSFGSVGAVAASWIGAVAAAESTDPAAQFAQVPAGKHAHFLKDDRVVTRLADPVDQDALAQMIDEVSMQQNITGDLGQHALSYSRKFPTGPGISRDDSGCTAMSKRPITRFSGLGQYAEVRVEAVRPESPLGCLGIGVTTWAPESLAESSFSSVLFGNFPKRLDNFPSTPSWIFTGPHNGTARKFYVDGLASERYSVKEECQRWKAGDLVGLHVRLDGQLVFYLNGTELITVAAPGLEEHAENGDLYLLVEAFGYVLACSLVPEPDPRKLAIAPEVSNRRLSNFLDLQSGNSTLCSGWLEKRGPNINFMWKRRWCVLTSESLVYWENALCKTKHGEITLSKLSKCKGFRDPLASGDAIKHAERAYGFVLDPDPTGGKDRRWFYFDAFDAESLHKWTHFIGVAVEMLGGESGNTTFYANGYGPSFIA